MPVRYGLWLARALQGDLGVSIATGRAVSAEVLAAVSTTLVLASVAAAVGVSLGRVLRALAGYRALCRSQPPLLLQPDATRRRRWLAGIRCSPAQ